MIPAAKLTLAAGECVILEPRVLAVGWREGRRCKRHKIKSDTVSTVSPSISHKVVGLDAMILVF